MNKDVLRKTIFVGLFLIPFIPFLVSSSLFFPFITTKAFAFRITIEIIFAAWVVLAVSNPEYRPKKSPILYALLAFLAVIGLANLFGAAPMKSFWSNFERMEGYVTLLHLGALFIVAGSVFKEREWNWWWNTSLSASALMVFYCLFQLAGVLEIHQGGVRVDGTLGNAAYLALYFLIHIFISIYFFLRAKTSGLRSTYLLLIAGQFFILYSTATRGAILGLLGGLFIITLLNLRNREDERVRKWSRYILVALVAVVAGVFLLRDTQFMQNSPVLSRFTHLNLSSWKTEGRAFIWPMAIEGIKERPLLGWGQENFNYVFAEHYQAEMYNLEPWFDRAHNIFLDWGVAGGVLGLGAYLSLYVVLILSIWRKESGHTHLERSVITGLLAAYFFNNLFVFDNLISYILFISILAQVHGRAVSKESSSPRSEGDDQAMVFPALGVAIVFVVVIYFVNIRPITTNTNLIGALKEAQTQNGGTVAMMDHFQRSFEGSRLGRPEAVEWISSSISQILGDEGVSFEDRSNYFVFAREAIESVAKELYPDPRYEIVAGSFYLASGQLDESLRHFEEAKKIMPQKQMIYWSIGQALYAKKDYQGTLAAFKAAYDLAPQNERAKLIYESAIKEFGN